MISTGMTLLKRLTATLFLLIIYFSGHSQEITCRDWYYIEDRNGNKIKGKCMVGWQENEIGQKHGKYVYYKETGAPQEIVFYKNDIAHGRYILYSENDATILDSGRYVNGKKSGKWIHEGNSRVTYNNDKPSGQAVRKYAELQLQGSYSATGLYSGKILLHEKTISTNPMSERMKIYTPPPTEEWLKDATDTRIINKYEYTLPFPSNTCSNCITDFPEELIERIYDQFTKKDYVFLVGDVTNGIIKAPEQIQIWVNGKVMPDSRSKINDIISNINKEKVNVANQQSLNEERKRKDDSGESMQDTKPFGLDVINFQPDSYEPDSNGKKAIEKLIVYLKTLEPATVSQFIIIGHSSADKELNKIEFNPKNEGILFDKAGRQTYFSEADLANLRMILSLGRVKNVYREIQSIPVVSELIDSKKFWMLPAGTLFGGRLVEKSLDQNVVQIIILTTDGHEINTLAEGLPFGTSFKESQVLKDINGFIRDLNYNFSKFIPAQLSRNTFGEPIPNYIELATSPTSLAHFTNQFR